MNPRVACTVFAFIVVVVGTVPSANAQISDYPGTVPTGRTQFEIDFAHTRDDNAGTRTDSFNASSILITHGLTARADIGLGFDGYYHDRYKTAGVTTTAHDWGDLTLRAKYSLWGHDNAEPAPGDTAFALLPYVTFPLKAGDYGSDLVLGGLILPLAITLPHDWTLVIMTEFDAIPDTTDRHREFQWIESVVLDRPLSDKTSGYIEFYSLLPAERGLDWQAQVNLGFYYSFTTALCIDVGANFGVTRSAPDLQTFAGLTYLY
ncbi:MAG: transporter [Opitutaceae bacterium]|nr:transporter [Opitutaceae bacterium]